MNKIEDSGRAEPGRDDRRPVDPDAADKPEASGPAHHGRYRIRPINVFELARKVYSSKKTSLMRRKTS